MRKILQFLAFFALLFSVVQAENCHHHRGRSKHNYFPAFRFVGTPVFLESCTAVSFLGEVGDKNYRLNGTLGYIYQDQHRFKFSGEYLAQKFDYHFASGKVRRWMHQSAVGGTYQYVFECPNYIKGIQLHSVYSHSYGHKLRTVQCTREHLEEHRRIAGAQFGSIEAGVLLAPWECNSFIVSVSYDQVRYRRHFHHDRRDSALGATLEMTQRFGRNWSVYGKAEFKKPYTYAEVLLNWNRTCSCGDLSIGAFASHLWGRTGLPDATAYGVQLGFTFGISGFGWRSDVCGNDDCCAARCCDCGDLAAWVATPAVYMPIVLGIIDSHRRSTCVAPTSSPIPNQIIQPADGYTIVAGDSFNGNGFTLTFSATGLPPDASFDPTTGTISGFNPGIGQSIFTVTVTGTSACGSTSETFTITYLAGA